MRFLLLKKIKTTQIPDYLGEIKEKLDNILANNPGYYKLCQIDDFINTKENIELPETVSPSIIPNFKYCPTISVDVERSFSAYKVMLNDRRRSLTMENLEKYMLVHIYYNINENSL
ncbi:hypothetical protein TKK_0009130 [Trichogramma kaykai]